MTRLSLILVIFLGSVLPSFGQDGNWVMYGYDAYNTSYFPSSKFSTPIGLKYSLNHDINFGGLGRSIVLGDTLIYTSGNQIYVTNIETKQVYWTIPYDISDELSSPCYAYGNIYLQIGDHSSSKLICLSVEDGALQWSTDYSVQWSDLTAPIVVGNHVIIVEGYFNTTMSSYDVFNGELNWSTSISGNNFDDWNPAVYDNKVYGYGDEFGVLDLETGEELKHIEKDELPYNWSGWSATANPVIDTLNNQVILVNNYFLFALDLDSYNLMWSISYEDYGRFTSTPALSGNSLYVGTSKLIMEISASSGQLVWSNEEYTGEYDPVVSDSLVVFSSEENTVIVNRETHQIDGGYKKGGNLILTEDYLIITESRGDKLYVLEQSSGNPITVQINVTDSIDCFGDKTAGIEVTVNGGSGVYDYQWEDSFTNSSKRQNLGAGEYTVTVYDEFFNNSQKSIIITEPAKLELVTSSSNATNGQSDGTATVTPEGGTSPYTYEWRDFPGINSPTVSYLRPGNYVVEVTDSKGCSSITTIVVDMVTNITTVANNSINLYPSVSSGTFNLSCSAEWIGANYRVVNNQGKTVKSGILLNETNLFSEDLSAGLYIFAVENGDKHQMLKLIIE